jgi:hypothetical protein
MTVAGNRATSMTKANSLLMGELKPVIAQIMIQVTVKDFSRLGGAGTFKDHSVEIF